MSSELCLANARIVLPDRVVPGAVHVASGRIAAVQEGDSVPAGAVDCAGDWLIPGLIELHTDNLERHIEPRPKVELPHETAILAHDGELAACGITTVFDALRIGSDAAPDGAVKTYARGVATEILALRDADALRIRHMLHLRAEVCSETLLNELGAFGPEDRVRLVSLMDHTPGERQFRDLSKLKVYHTGKHGASDDDFAAFVSRRRALRDRVGDAHEAATVVAAARFGAALASHDDTTPEQVARSARLGIRLAEFPTTAEAAQACRTEGMRIIMGAPNLVRGGSHSGNVSATDLARQGLLDVISSDYVPALLLVSAFRLARIWGDLPRAIRTVSETPAAATGLADRGRIAEGCLGDLVRVRRLGETPVVRAVWRGGVRVG